MSHVCLFLVSFMRQVSLNNLKNDLNVSDKNDKIM